MIWAHLYLIEDFDIYVSVSPQNMKNSKQLSRKPAPPCRSQEKVDLPASRRRQKHFIMLRSLFNATCLALLQNFKQSRATIMESSHTEPLPTWWRLRRYTCLVLPKKVDYWLQKAGASAVPNMGILSGDSQADMRSFYYSSSRKSTLKREEDDKRHDSRW